MTSRISARMAMQQDAYEVFHDYWNLLTALNSYVAVLRHSQAIGGLDREAVEQIAKLMGELEHRMETVRARVLSMIG